MTIDTSTQAVEAHPIHADADPIKQMQYPSPFGKSIISASDTMRALLSERDAAIARAEAAEARLASPDHIYDPEEWEFTFPYQVRNDLAEDVCDDVKRYSTLINGPDVFAAKVPTEFTDDGDVIQEELRWFDSEEAARAALEATS